MAKEKFNQSVFLVLKVAYLYYLKDKPQNEIADILGVSITTVSRLLRKAREDKIIEFVIRDPYIECLRLEREIKERFQLKDVIIAPGININEAGESRMVEDNVKQLVGLEGARYLQRVIQEDDILGITWGSTVHRMINCLNPAQKVQAKFVTLHGSIASCEMDLDVRTLVSQMAKAFSGTNYYLLTEALMSSQQALEMIKRERNNWNVFAMFPYITISVNGVGSFYPIQNSALAKPDFMSAEDLHALQSEGVVGDIALRFFNKDGCECNTSLAKRMVTIDLEAFKRIPTKITVASGAWKAHALHAALKGRLIDVLIVDYKLAEALQQL